MIRIGLVKVLMMTDNLWTSLHAVVGGSLWTTLLKQSVTVNKTTVVGSYSHLNDDILSVNGNTDPKLDP